MKMKCIKTRKFGAQGIGECDDKKKNNIHYSELWFGTWKLKHLSTHNLQTMCGCGYAVAMVMAIK